jgi:N-acetyl-anhydromuramyl-L-alanine amidase AmpD
MFTWISSLAEALRLVPSLAGGAVARVEGGGDTDQMAAAPAVDVAPTPVVTSTASSRPGPVMDRTTLRLAPGQYYREATKKSLIVLHFTAGSSARGAYQSWVTDSRVVATAYIVDLDGRIYETFDPRFWAYALGVRGAAGPANERRAIQIEIVGWGPLKLRGEYLCSWPKNWTQKYCHVRDTHKYVRAPYRGVEYFSTYPEPQVASVSALVGELCDRFQIPRDVCPPDLRGRADVARASRYTGILEHATFRSDKWDCGPAFPWDRLSLELAS